MEIDFITTLDRILRKKEEEELLGMSDEELHRRFQLIRQHGGVHLGK